jgi:cyclic pyranopterin phosphate synthase
MTPSFEKMIDPFGRRIDYLRLSVTDRCDFRCIYCMSDQMTFMPRASVLTLEELGSVARAFVALGVTKIRVTGGEPLVRQNVDLLFREIADLEGLTRLCITTNGAQLSKRAAALKMSGVSHVNISLDSLCPERFKRLTRYGDLALVLAGIRAAKQVGFCRVKLNAVILKNFNQDEVLDLVRFALQNNLDISFIEEMPLGDVLSHSRRAEFVSSQSLRDQISTEFRLFPSEQQSGGPSRYWKVPGFGSRIGFISPHSENFCDQCNRVRVTASGRLLLCLGNENSLDLRALLRSADLAQMTDAKKIACIKSAIKTALQAKPERHSFYEPDTPQPVRFMNMTGG